MSTFYATFDDVREARRLLHELLRAGVGPDDVSLLQRETTTDAEASIRTVGTVGDATSFVGRDDDPRRDSLLPAGPDITDKTSVIASPIGGIDTSNKATNVDSVDQSDDSQTYAEDSIQPWQEISQGEHEKDDLVLATETGFPTPVPVIDDIVDTETPVEDQMDDAVEAIALPGVGTVLGGGALATAALEFDGAKSVDSLEKFLVDRGIPKDRVGDFTGAFENGQPLLAVELTPGAIDEGTLEQYVDRHHPIDAEMFDAPRFYDASRGDARLM